MLPTRFPNFPTALCLGVLAAALLGGGCKTTSPTTGEFEALTSNLSSGDVWSLNRPIQLVFNNAVDPNSIGFGSVIIRPTDLDNLGSPVTGVFSLEEDSKGNANHVVVFTPSCPTNAANDNGGLVPGGKNYELILPTLGDSGSAVLRDTSGRQLGTGLARTFRTPELGEALFADTTVGPPTLESVTVPNSLGLLSADRMEVLVEFNQSIDPDPANLAVSRLFVQYSNDGAIFPSSGNVVPGEWLVVANCGDGALLHYRVSGILIPGRSLRVVATAEFQDIGGNTNSTAIHSTPVVLPTLAEIYASGPAFTETDVTVDEFQDDFGHPRNLDQDADLPQPSAEIEPNSVHAHFDYPGSAVAVDHDLVVTANQGLLTLTTDDGSHDFSDGLGRDFTITDGVLELNDLTIEAGATLRAVGENPLVIYASGEVNLLGTLDASGFHAEPPDGGTYRPDLVVPGAAGACGGGAGGAASQTTDSWTVRAESGQGPLGLSSGGGQGGEGGFQQHLSQAGGNTRIESTFVIAGGGGGGGFSLARTDAVFWALWDGDTNPVLMDDAGPDLRDDRHTAFDGVLDPDTVFTGAEDGIRGSAFHSGRAGDFPHGVHGYEDLAEDGSANDSDGGVFNQDPARTSSTESFEIGSLTSGPDGGLGGSSVFTDGNLSNDFYGSRYHWDGNANTTPTLVTGELLSPHAGGGGGGSGDMQLLWRYLDDGGMPPTIFPLIDHWPDPHFPHGPATPAYYRGAGGGGGGGQVQIHALGAITLGPNTTLKVNGGAGQGGESAEEGAGTASTHQVSGSGGGAGGHMILHTTTGLNLASISVGTAGDPGDPDTFFDSLTANYVLQAIGGRRGWANANSANSFNAVGGATNDVDYDGNGNYNVGRGGAGASGVIQIHVPDPVNDVTYHSSVDSAFKLFITGEDLTNPAISSRVDQVLGLYSMPQPFALVPLYSPQSQVQSEWIDTGLAELRSNSGSGTYPAYMDALLHFDGIDEATGLVETTANTVTAGSVVGADGGAGTATFSNYSVTITNPSVSFADDFLRNPALLVGYDVIANNLQTTPDTFEITSASYTASPESLVLTTRVSDGPMALVGSVNWEVQSKFFQIYTSETKDRLPVSASVRIQFQGTEAVAGSNTPDTSASVMTDWTGDGTTTLADLDGSRFIRYRVTFNIDALDSGPTVDKERPGLKRIKLPVAW